MGTEMTGDSSGERGGRGEDDNTLSYFVDGCFRETITFLMNEGLLYSTIDDEHYKSAAA